jgi:hypothetical protein
MLLKYYVLMTKTKPTDKQQCVRHEVSYVIVLLMNNETRPAIPLAVPYVVMRDGNVTHESPQTMYPQLS